MRHNPSTVVVLAGQPGDGLLAAVSPLMNVSVVRPDAGDAGRRARDGAGGGATGGPPGGPAGGSTLETAAAALRRAAGISSPYVLVAADPLALVAAEWRAMWQVGQEPRGSDSFELRAGEALAAWRARQFELPDYYLVLARDAAGREPGTAAPGGPQATGPGPAPDFYLGPLRALRAHRVAVVAASETAEQAAGIQAALGSLRHGPWWPPLPDVIDAARRFYPGSLADTPDGPSVPLLA